MWGQLSTTCSNATDVTQWPAPSCSPPHPAMYNGVRDGKSNWLTVTLHPTAGSTPWTPRISRYKCGAPIARHAATSKARTRDLRNARPTHCLCGHSGYAQRQKAVQKQKQQKKMITKIMTTKQIFWRLDINSTYFPVQMQGTNCKTCCNQWGANMRPSECQACAATQGIHSFKRLYKSRNKRKKW